MLEIRNITDKDSMPDVSNIYEQSWKYAYKGKVSERE